MRIVRFLDPEAGREIEVPAPSPDEVATALAGTVREHGNRSSRELTGIPDGWIWRLRPGAVDRNTGNVEPLEVEVGSPRSWHLRLRYVDGPERDPVVLSETIFSLKQDDPQRLAAPLTLFGDEQIQAEGVH
jgi:hypothetical protein